MKEKSYSEVIANAIKSFLKEDDWHFSFNEDRGLFRFGLALKGKLKKLRYIVDVKDDEYLVYAISPIGADEDDDRMMANMAEFICRANYGLKAGNFEFDFSDGEIRFKDHVSCEDITPSAAMIKRSIYCPAMMFDRYGSGIVDVIFNDTSAKDAVAKCEEDGESELRHLLTQMLGDDDGTDSEDGTLDVMIERLATRFGISLDDDSEQLSNDDNIEIHTDPFEKKGGASV